MNNYRLVRKLTSIAIILILASKESILIIKRNNLKTKVILIGLLTILYGCAAQGKKPDLKKIDYYPMYFHSSGLEIHAIGEKDLRALNGNSVTFYKTSGLLLLNLNVRNTSPYAILIDRSSIYLLTESDMQFPSISGNDALEVYMHGWFGFKQLLVPPDIVDTCRSKSMQNNVSIEPYKNINTYIFFKVDEKNYNAALNGELFINIKRVQIVDNIQYKLDNKKRKNNNPE
jgi:hypothetical protein